jgi:sulfate adenylyltransferase
VTPTPAELTGLISPYGGTLTDLVVPPDIAIPFAEYGNSLPSVRLSARAMCDLELLACGGFSPLDGFMNSRDYRRVVEEMRLADGRVFPIPVTLPVDVLDVREGSSIGLRDERNNLIAVMDVEEVYEWDRAAYCGNVLGTQDPNHPTAAESAHWGKRNIAGKLHVLRLPEHYDFPQLRLTPRQSRACLSALDGVPNVVAFQTRNPLHRAHEELVKRAVERTGGVLLLHPVAGVTKAGDVDHFVRVRTYRALAKHYLDPRKTLLALLPLAMRFAGPREALWHALIRRNYGADHFIIGRDHASPGVDSAGRAFYEPYAAQHLVETFAGEIGIKPVPFEEFVYLPDEGEYRERTKVEHGKKYFSLSGRQVREDFIEKGEPLPEWFTRPEIAAILQRSFVPKHQRGFAVWFTGLSGAGKSTTAEVLAAMLTARERAVTLLDGDIVRTHLSAGLGFDKEGRDANVRRIGFVAAEIVRHGGIAVCAAVSPYRSTRDEVRRMVGENFIEVFVDTPLEVCERRDIKGMYAKARRGEIKNFTGVSDVYEPPQSCEVTIDTTRQSAQQNAALIADLLIRNGLLLGDDDPGVAADPQPDSL